MSEMDARPAATQNDDYFTIPVTYVDVAGAAGDGQTEFPCEFFFNDEVYLYCCEGCGEDIKNGMEDVESGVSYCFRCLADSLKKGYAKITKREDA